jgi:Periplasmic copper-binding protein (NosD)
MRLLARMTRLSYFVICTILFPLSGWAANVTVDCSGGTPGAFTSLQAAINSLDLTGPHQITVIGGGPCNENVLIVDRQRLTITAAPVGKFFTSPVGAADDVMTISGSTGITLIQLGFRGGSRGVVIGRNSEVSIHGTTIETNAFAGIRIDGNSTVSFDGLIQNNGGAGINAFNSTLNVGARILSNGGPGIGATDSSVIVAGEIRNNGGVGVVLRRSRGQFLGNVIQGNFNGVNIVNGSSAEFDAPNTIQNNLYIGVNVGSGSSVRFFGDVAPDGTPLANVISGNPFIGLNINGTVVMFDANQILNNGFGGQPLHAGVRVDDNAVFGTSGSGDIQIGGNTGPGIEATVGGALDMTGTVVSNNTEDGIRLLGNSQVGFFPPNTNVLAGNGGQPISCDNTSIFFGDRTGLPEIPCKIAELKDRRSASERRRMMKEEREEK